MAGVQQLLECMISNWYPSFQRATFKTVILPLPKSVLDWLVSDGLHLPDDSQAVRAPSRSDAMCSGARLMPVPLLPPLPLLPLRVPLGARATGQRPCTCRLQFAKRGPLDEYALEDEYREWSHSEEEGAGSDAGSAAPQVGRGGGPR